MINDKSRCGWIAAVVVLLAVAFAVVRIIITVTYYDVYESLYRADAVNVGVLRVVFAVSLLALGVFTFFFTPKRKYKELPEATHGVVFTGSLCGFMFISSVILETVYFCGYIFVNIFNAIFLKQRVKISATDILTVFSLIFCIFSSLYYFWTASTTLFRKVNYKILSVMPSLWAACYAVTIYFSKNTVINSPERMIIQFSVIMIMLYTVSEARFHFGIARPRLHIALSAITVVSIITACMPNFILTAFWFIPFSSDTVFSVLQLGIAMYILQRMISIMNAKTEE